MPERFGSADDTPAPKTARFGSPDDVSRETPPETTAGGVAASLARGAAPIALGAGIGAMAGAPFGGVGAIPGAAFGATAMGLTDLAGTIYNPIAEHTGLPHMKTPSEITGSLMDTFGIQRPSTGIERGAELVGGMVPFGGGAAKTAVEAGLPELVASGQAKAADKWIDRMYSKAIGPRVAGRDTPLQRREAISEIIGNKATLEYVDAEGKAVARGRLPESLDEMGQAIDQSKTNLFRQWNIMAKLSGGAGGRVDLTQVAKSLREYAADPSLMRNNPAAAAHAEDMAARYERSGAILPEEAQRDLVILNQNLRGYYRNPLPIAPAEEEAARSLRAALDDTITKTTGPGYQELRNRYGSLRAVEDDVDKATRRVSNWRAGGGVFGPTLNVASLLSGAEGVFHGDWKGVAASIATKGLGEYAKARQHPNAIVKRIFSTAEKYHGASP